MAALLAAFLVVAALAWQTGRAAADAPVRTGWWNAANTGAVEPPVPPDVHDDDLYVAAGPPGASPSAFSAVLIALPDGQTAKTLTLTPSNTPSPNLAVQACLIPTGDFPGGGNQASSAAPAYDCTKVQPAPGQVDAASGAVTFAIGSLSEAATASTPGKVAVAIVPTGADRVAFGAPDTNSVALEASASSTSDSSSTDTQSSSSTYDQSPSSSGSTSATGPTTGTATTGGFDSGSALLSGGSTETAAAPAATAASPADTGPGPASATAAAAPASGSPARSSRLPGASLATAHPSGTATKVGGALALLLLIAALIAYIRGFGLMGGRIAD